MSPIINRVMASGEVARVLEAVVTSGLYVRPLAVPGWVFAGDHRGAVVAFQLTSRERVRG